MISVQYITSFTARDSNQLREVMGACTHSLLIALALMALASSATLQQQTLTVSNKLKETKIHRFEYDNGFYEVSDTEEDWYTAKNECAKKGMELVSFETEEEQEAIVYEIKSPEEPYWLAGSDQSNHLGFYWESTGIAMGPFRPWGLYSPGKIGPVRECVSLDSVRGTFLWYDSGCTLKFRYICEQRERVADPTLEFNFGTVNYKISSQRLNWWKAKFDCRSKGMRLVSIESEIENEAILEGIGTFDVIDDFWLSATNLGYFNGDFYWDSTGEFFNPDFNDWMEGEPNLGLENHYCAHVAGNWSLSEHNRWKIADCYSSKRYICESYDDNGRPDDKKAAIETNQKALKRFSFLNSTYEVSDTTENWYLAKIECHNKGMELLSIESKEEQAALVIGLGDAGENFWTSGNSAGQGKQEFVWDSTGRLYWQYANWGVGQPNKDDENAIGNCIILNHVNGYQWQDDGCESINLKYICEKKESRGDELITFTFGTTHYEAGAFPLSWWDANRACRSKGMRLTSINNEDEDNIISFIFSILDKPWGIWTSGVDYRSTDEFVWDSNGQVVGPYTNWATNETTNNCLILNYDGATYNWDTEDCLLPHVYLCESHETGVSKP